MWRALMACKTIALLVFLLPWMAVSCSGRKVGSGTGFDLTIGRLTLTNPMNGVSETHTGSPSFWLVLSLLLIVIGLWIALQKGKESARYLLGTSLGAFLSSWIGTSRITPASLVETAQRQQGTVEQAANAAALSMIRVDWLLGYWIHALALAAAAAIAWLIMSNREDLVTSAVGNLTGNADTTFWNNIPDKSDSDALQEYLIRFPEGRFAELAKQKLVGLNAVPAATSQDQPAAAPIKTCPSCGKRQEGLDICPIDGAVLV